MILLAGSEGMSVSEGNAKLLTSLTKTRPLSGVENEAHQPWGVSSLTALSSVTLISGDMEPGMLGLKQ